ncbi:MAG: group 1 glycosyl transferase [Parcubacteria group bacterium GW2011_GWE2_39_37]|uniref:Group 1 glycosyl transferase n=1 Tax=Candidatus Falkowbacteria bacterium GW2011_GWF2_39_8 TaxID=1618642 RepID=A0A0G0PZB6_9BACT|nr:MAG: group 1 glycosyl transferase [Parcubacteria group bacterium GW2011_GWE2_39_37]KKR33459.1 MAG: group 1 glycosyl transferase [Candidatus Falkowbacteria bacterium GW2011_GWF2_39_8]
MRVLLVNKFNYLKGGADKYFIELAELLNQGRVETAKFCMAYEKNLPDKDSGYFLKKIDFNDFKFSFIFKYLSRILFSFEAAKKFELLLNDFKPDIVHIHNIYHQISPSILMVAKKHKLPIVMHLHDFKLLCPNYKMYTQDQVCERCKGGKFFNCTKYRCLKNSYVKSLLATIEMYFHHKILRIYEKNIIQFIAPSEFVKNKAIEWGIPAEKISLLPYFIKLDEFTPDFTVGNYWLYFGRLEKEKGIYTLLEAINMVNDGKLKIVGIGSESENIKKYIIENNLSSKVELLGAKYGQDLKLLIAQARAVIVPSEWYEVSGIVNLEALALGKLVIASNIGGIKEIITDNQTGLLFTPGSVSELAEKMKIAAENDLMELAKAGRESVVIKYNDKFHLNKILELYKRYAKN